MGLDLSLTGAAACALPLDWDHDLSRVRMMPMAGYALAKDASAEEQRTRIISIRDVVLEFCLAVRACHVYVEGYAYAAMGRIEERAELVGVVKVGVWERYSIGVEPVTPMRARTVLLQKTPRKDAKAFARVNVKRLGGPARFWNDDEVDAFVVANACLMDAGGVAMTWLGSW